MTARLRALGVPESYIKHAQLFERQWRNHGWSQAMIDKSIQWAVNYSGSPDEAADSFQHFTHASLGIPSDDAFEASNWALSLRDEVDARGVEDFAPVPQASFGETERKRLEEIRQLRRDDPNAYTRAGRALELEELDLLEAQGTSHSGRPTETAQPVSPNVVRLEEIRAARRADPQSYESNKSVQAEEFRLLGGNDGGQSDVSNSTSQAVPAGAGDTGGQSGSTV
jgi:hypothetical protein